MSGIGLGRGQLVYYSEPVTRERRLLAHSRIRPNAACRTAIGNDRNAAVADSRNLAVLQGRSPRTVIRFHSSLLSPLTGFR